MASRALTTRGETVFLTIVALLFIPTIYILGETVITAVDMGTDWYINMTRGN
jgi:hypothetical protein